MEQFAAWQLRDQGAGVHIVARRLSALSSFYKWGAKHEIVTGDPVALADKPNRPHRIPVWLEKDEQKRLEATVKTLDDLPDNILAGSGNTSSPSAAATSCCSPCCSTAGCGFPRRWA